MNLLCVRPARVLSCKVGARAGLVQTIGFFPLRRTRGVGQLAPCVLSLGLLITGCALRPTGLFGNDLECVPIWRLSYETNLDRRLMMGQTETATAVREMPRYKCHKEVEALKIAAAERHEDGSVTLAFVDPSYPTITLSASWGVLFRPKNDDPGYFVEYIDGGYRSWSPTDVFESGYTLIGD